MSTGGLALLLSQTPHRFDGLNTIGKVVFIFDIVVFVSVCTGISVRFLLYPGTLRASLTHPTEALFFPTAFLALQNIFNCMQNYGGPSVGEWLVTTEQVLFWLYVGLTLLVAILQYLYLFTGSKATLDIQGMTPAWVLPVFPVMLSGTFASAISASQPPGSRMPIIVGAISLQGLGWMVSFLMYAMYLHRLMQFGLPAPDLRPGMFIAVGPPSFTASALIGISQALPSDYGYFKEHREAVVILQTMAVFLSILLWALAFWFFCLSFLAVLLGARRMSFHLVWWAFSFPNVGFTIATIDIGKAFKSEGILWVTSIMTILLVAMWLFVLASHLRAFLKQHIMMPGLDEDKDEPSRDDEDRAR